MKMSLSVDPDEQMRAENLLWVISKKEHTEITLSNSPLVDLLSKFGLVTRILGGSHVSATRKGMLVAQAYERLFPKTA